MGVSLRSLAATCDGADSLLDRDLPLWRHSPPCPKGGGSYCHYTSELHVTYSLFIGGSPDVCRVPLHTGCGTYCSTGRRGIGRRYVRWFSSAPGSRSSSSTRSRRTV